MDEYVFNIFGTDVECDVCDKAGHVCDADTGRCVCPPWTEGDRCQHCAAAAWNYHPLKGCTVI